MEKPSPSPPTSSGVSSTTSSISQSMPSPVPSPKLLPSQAHHAHRHGRGGSSGLLLGAKGLSHGSGLSSTAGLTASESIGPPPFGTSVASNNSTGHSPHTVHPTLSSSPGAAAAIPGTTSTFGNLRSRSNSMNTAGLMSNDNIGLAIARSPGGLARARIGSHNLSMSHINTSSLNNNGPMPSHLGGPLGSPVPHSRGLERAKSATTPVLTSPRSVPNSPAIPFVPPLGSSSSMPLEPTSPTLMSTSNDPTTTAINAAREKEHNRAREREKEEMKMSDEQLRAALRRERAYSCKIAMDLAAMKSQTVAIQFEAEVCEEGRINGLMKRLDHLRQEKGRILIELEREEEALTNNLQNKLNEVRREKAELERKIKRQHSDMETQKDEKVSDS